MIEGIERIKGLGVYGDYRPPQGIQPFGMKNIFYGWNYSGKTTLSRVFATIERGHVDHDMPFEFGLRVSGRVVDHTNFQGAGMQVRVFNSDFVAANLNFSGDPFHPIFLLGEESKAAIDKIARCDKLIERLDAKEAVVRRANDQAASALSTARTAAAAALRESLSLKDAFRADHLDREAAQVRKDPKAWILEGAPLQADLRLARSADQDRLPPISSTSLDIKLRSLREEAERLLSKSPGMANTLQRLLDSPEIERWILAGVKLHTHAESCSFCGGALSPERLSELRAHFSKELADHDAAIRGLITRAEQARLTFSPRAEAELYAPFRDRYQAAAEALKQAIGRHNAEVDAILAALAKKAESPRTPIELAACAGAPWTETAQAVEALNAIVAENNKVSNNFDQSKAEAIKKLRAHYAAEFVESAGLDRLDLERQAREARRGQLHRLRNLLRAEASKQRAVINRAQKGREEINARLKSLLGAASISIEVVEVGGEERFQLRRRDGRPATHLSEGEKTAIAFSYFMAKLKELPDLAEAIVCIDDPISSLDSNHVFQVVAAIRHSFFHQVAAGGGMEWRTRCKQLFVLTHNFNFFALMREIKPDKKSHAKARHYLVKRVSPTASSIVNMPAALLHYSSEYHFLFGVLDRFRKERGDGEMELLMMLPNAMRRFVELYTYSRMPSSDEVSVDSRAEALFGPETAKRVLKTLHYFSHANSIERMAENNDLICDIEAAIEEMLSHIEREDPIHWNALTSAHG